MSTKTKKILAFSGVVIVIGLLVSWNRIFPTQPAVIWHGNPDTLPGIMTTAAPWVPETAHLRERIKDIGLHTLTQEGSVLHIHQHIDIAINGTPVAIPAGIGIDPLRRFIAPVHTHNTSGIIHVESPVTRTFTLGEFFDIWGVRFSATCIGKYCSSATSTLEVYVNGSRIRSNPRNIALANHQEIDVLYDNASSTPSIISHYNFPPNE